VTVITNANDAADAPAPSTALKSVHVISGRVASARKPPGEHQEAFDVDLCEQRIPANRAGACAPPTVTGAPFGPIVRTLIGFQIDYVRLRTATRRAI